MRKLAPVERGRTDPVLSTCWVDHVEIGFGIAQYTCFSRRSISPVGVVWGIFAWFEGEAESRFDITHIYTNPMYRRHGVGTFLLNHILKECRVLLTWTVTEEGEKFAKAFGFKQDERRAQWYYVRPKEKKK